MYGEYVTCLTCHYFHYSAAEPDWSESTRGWPVCMSCDETPPKWIYDVYDMRQKDFVKMLLTANRCKKYKRERG